MARELGKVRRSGYMTCGLCDGAGDVASSFLGHWRHSAEHGLVHTRCFKRLRRKIARVKRLPRDGRGRFRKAA